MRRKVALLGGAAALSLYLIACSDITSPRLVTSFDWGEVEDPGTVVEGITTSVAFGSSSSWAK